MSSFAEREPVPLDTAAHKTGRQAKHKSQFITP